MPSLTVDGCNCHLVSGMGLEKSDCVGGCTGHENGGDGGHALAKSKGTLPLAEAQWVSCMIRSVVGQIEGRSQIIVVDTDCVGWEVSGGFHPHEAPMLGARRCNIPYDDLSVKHDAEKSPH